MSRLAPRGRVAAHRRRAARRAHARPQRRLHRAPSCRARALRCARLLVAPDDARRCSSTATSRLLLACGPGRWSCSAAAWARPTTISRRRPSPRPPDGASSSIRRRRDGRARARATSPSVAGIDSSEVFAQTRRQALLPQGARPCRRPASRPASSCATAPRASTRCPGVPGELRAMWPSVLGELAAAGVARRRREPRRPRLRRRRDPGRRAHRRGARDAARRGRQRRRAER